jgi:hypothetical protein
MNTSMLWTRLVVRVNSNDFEVVPVNDPLTILALTALEVGVHSELDSVVYISFAVGGSRAAGGAIFLAVPI